MINSIRKCTQLAPADKHLSNHEKARLDRWIENNPDGLHPCYLPTDSSRTARTAPDYQAYEFSLSEAQAESLKALANQNAFSMASLLVSTFFLLLHRYTNQEELTIGFEIPIIAPEPTLTVADIVINVLPFSLKLLHDEPLQDLIHRAQDSMAAIMELQEIPASYFLYSSASTLTGRNAKPSINISLTNILDAPHPAGVFLEPLEGLAELTLQLMILDSGLHCRIRYDSQLYGQSRIQKIADQYVFLLRQAPAVIKEKFGKISLLDTMDMKLVPDPTLVIPEPVLPAVGQLFLQAASSFADNIAVTQDNQNWSYRDLSSAAKQLAFQIIHSGISRGDTVAVCGVRCFGTIASMLGVLMSGGVLLSLDSSLPLVRRLMMLKEASAKLVLFIGIPEAEYLELSGSHPTLVLDPATGKAGDSTNAADLPTVLPALLPDDPAYIFFTSGSTGTPKGVLGVHRGLSHFLLWQGSTFKIGPSDRHSQLTSLSFDVVLRDVFLPLLNGATLCLPGAFVDVVSPGILEWLRKEQVTIIHAVPSLARSWLREGSVNAKIPTLRIIFLAGEPLTEEFIKGWRKEVSATTRIVNLYGPTETTLAKCYSQILPGQCDPGIQPIGHAIPNAQALILSRDHALCAPLEVGEIVIRTPFRTKGYINNTQANRALFIMNPFTTQENDILYLTGDLGRYRHDGILEILGRIDNQIKIRGIRIEPGEIEAALKLFPGLLDCIVVVAKNDQSTDLVAYVVMETADNAKPTVRSLRRFLEQSLPVNMIPGIFVQIPRMPLNSNGKVDRRSLPPPTTNIDLGTDYCPPSTDVEQSIATIFQKVLSIDAIGIDDGFFDLGGHSLLAVQAVRRIEATLGLPVTMPMLFHNPTIRGLAAAIEQNSGIGGNSNPVVTLQKKGNGPPLYCVVGIQLYHQLAQHLGPETPVYGVILRHEQDFFESSSSRYLAMEDMAAEYIRVIKNHTPHGPYFIAGLSFGGVLAYEIAQQLQNQGDKVPIVALFDSLLPGSINRNYIKWLAEHIHNLVSMGPKYVVQKIADRFIKLKKLKYITPDPVQENHGSISDYTRLDKLRSRIYRIATENYKIKAYKGKVLLFKATEVGGFKSDLRDPSYGWAKYISDLVEYDVPGDHLTMLSEPNVSYLAGKLKPYLKLPD